MRPLLTVLLLSVAAAACSSPAGEGAACADTFDCEAPLVCTNKVCASSSKEEKKDGGSEVELVPPNNRAELSGAEFGTGAETNANLAAPIAIDVKTTPAGLRVGNATKARSDVSSGHYRILVPIENTGRNERCFVRASYRVLNAAGGLLDEQESYVQGSVGNGSAGYTDTCIWPEESGWSLILSDGAAWDAITKVEVSISTTEGAYSRPEPRLLPTSYRVDNGKVVVTAENPGPGTVAFDTARFIYLGSDGAPLGWTITSISPEPQVATGEMLEIAESVAWKGRASKVDVLLDFERR